MTDRSHPLHPLGVALTTLLAATLLFPWALPRETVSGLIGRWLSTERGWKRRVAVFVASWVDAYVHLPLGTETCVEHYELEERARRAIYDSRVYDAELDDFVSEMEVGLLAHGELTVPVSVIATWTTELRRKIRGC